MTGLSPAGEAAILTPLTTNAFVSLHISDPGTTGATEVSGSGYARQGPVAFSNTGNEPTVAANTAIVTYPAATGSGWGTITYFGIWTAATAGVFQGSGQLTAPTLVSSGDITRFVVGALTITAQ
jgi:hypothetical protein